MTNPEKRPLAITFLGWLVLVITALNVVRVATAFAWRAAVDTYAGYPGALYIGATGLVWVLTGTMVLWGIWRRTAWALRSALAGALVYAAWDWTDRLAVQSHPPANWVFSMLVTAVLLGSTLAATLNPRNQAYFIKRGP